MEQLNRAELRGVIGNIKLQPYPDSTMARITVVTNYAYKDKEGNAIIDSSWHNVVAWEGRNIRGLDKLKKGDKVFVQGRIRYQKYTGSDGIERTSTDIFAGRLVLVDDPDPLQYEMQ